MNYFPDKAFKSTPDNDAPVVELVAFCVWNDSNGNWPERIDHRDCRIPGDSREGTISPPINADHVWYDWESDVWFTDDEIREQLLPIINEWRNDQ